MIHTPNLILTGFMGTGKTTVGRTVAARLGREFVDMDTVIEQEQGCSISDLFAARGESYFREVERQLCKQLANRGGLVIATGGGALVDDSNRSAFASSGTIICLSASAHVLSQRLQGSTSRPLLNGADALQRIEALLAERRDAYASLEHQLDTSNLSHGQVVDQVLALWDARRTVISVSCPDGEYSVVVGRGLLSDIGQFLHELGLSRQAVVITDANVGCLYATTVARSLEHAGFHSEICQMPAGEEHKRLDTVAGLYDQLVAFRQERRDAVVALGGGVVGDVAGFCAATYLRGVPLVQIPTTLLSMVDSSVGGKVAVDHPGGKNLVGSFKNPRLVVADLDTLDSLPARQIANGMAEVIKHGIIADPMLFRVLAEGSLPWHELVTRAIVVKQDVVQTDPFEQGIRANLNLGHTFGHALEACSNYAMQHGEAVSIGLVAAARLSERLEIAEQGLADLFEAALLRNHLPVRYSGFSPEELVQAMGSDKKRTAGRQRFILPVALGSLTIRDDVPQDAVMAIWQRLRTV